MQVVRLTFKEFLEGRVSWDEALRRNLDSNIFLTWEWLSTWWRHFGDKREFMVAEVIHQDRILAAAPFMSTTYSLLGVTLRKLQIIGNKDSDYQTFLITDRKHEFVRAILEDQSNNWGLAEFNDVPEDSITARGLQNVPKRQCSIEQQGEEICPHVTLPRTFSEYVNTLPASLRKDLLKRERKARRDCEVEFRIYEKRDDVQDAMLILFKLHQKRHTAMGRPGVFSNQRVREFHLDVAQSFADRGWFVLATLMLDGEPAAAAYGFKYGNKLYGYQSGFDPRYSKYGPLSLVHLHLIERSIGIGVQDYDFLRGDEPYKRQWNTSPRANLGFKLTRRRIVPTLFRWATKNDLLGAAVFSMRKIEHSDEAVTS